MVVPTHSFSSCEAEAGGSQVFRQPNYTTQLKKYCRVNWVSYAYVEIKLFFQTIQMC